MKKRVSHPPIAKVKIYDKVFCNQKSGIHIIYFIYDFGKVLFNGGTSSNTSSVMTSTYILALQNIIVKISLPL